MSKLTPVFKCCNEMTTIALWPQSFTHKNGQSEVSLVIRMIDIIAAKYIQQYAGKYHEVTGYVLPSEYDVSHQEAKDIAEDCKMCVVKTKEKIQSAKDVVKAREKKIDDIKKTPLKPVDTLNPFRYQENISDVIEREKNYLESDKSKCVDLCEVYEKAITVLSIGENIASDVDHSWIFKTNLEPLDSSVISRIGAYKSVFSAISLIVNKKNSAIKKVEYSPAMSFNYYTQEYINEELSKLTEFYYNADNEALRNTVTLTEFSELYLPKLKDDAGTFYLASFINQKDLI
ncbi:hypothetical protein VQ372_003552 [Salmonella enterica]|nr:hypothetical protein [Salmonella enterica]EMD4738904.1 hypothetical protein [Salmonella enterica]EMD4776523.1 hypothetical protein [Salmonella enterica]EMD4795619.1 hypothetical protein [Salmonella enterica]EMD4800639.1 hypothetical protein [Salmonella enterica]